MHVMTQIQLSVYANLHRAPPLELAELLVAMIQQLLGSVSINGCALQQQPLSVSGVAVEGLAHRVLHHRYPPTSIDSVVGNLQLGEDILMEGESVALRFCITSSPQRDMRNISHVSY